MKKKLLGPILTGVALLLLAGMFVYFFMSLNKIDKKTQEIAEIVSQNSGQSSAIINYLNTNLNAGQ